MKQPNAPCMDCTDRVPPTPASNGCKSYCEKWRRYEVELNEWRKFKNEKWMQNEAVLSYENERASKAKRVKLKIAQNRRKNGR